MKNWTKTQIMGQRWPTKNLKHSTKNSPNFYDNSKTFYNQVKPSQTPKIAKLTKSQLLQNGSNGIPKRRARRNEPNGTILAIRNLLELSESPIENQVKIGQSQRIDQVKPIFFKPHNSQFCSKSNKQASHGFSMTRRTCRCHSPVLEVPAIAGIRPKQVPKTDRNHG